MMKGRGLKERKLDTSLRKIIKYLMEKSQKEKNRKKLTSIIMKADFLYLPVVTDAKIVPRTLTDLTEFFC